MSTLTTCPTCGGQFAATQDDGSTYTHVCPPIHRARVTRSGKTIDVDRPNVVATDVRVADLFVERGGRAAGAVTTVPVPVSA